MTDKLHESAKEETPAGQNRSEIKEILETKGGKPADFADLVEKLELKAQYDKRLDTLKHYGFLSKSGEAKEGDVQAPDYERVMAAFTLEELEIASHFQKPTLLIIPKNSFEAKVEALDAHKQGMQENDTYVDKIYAYTDSDSDKITGWRAVIVDGAEEMEVYEGDDVYLSFDERIGARETTRKKGEKGMDRHFTGR